jgi:filamentous hemagglutinin
MNIQIKNSNQNMFRKKMIKKTTALITAFTMMFQATAPAMAAILPDSAIQIELNNNTQFERDNNYEYQFVETPYLKGSVLSSTHMASFYNRLEEQYLNMLGAPTYVPIAVGDITTIFPIYKKYKKVGSPLVQSRYIRAQVNALLGRNLIDSDVVGYENETNQINTLYENAIDCIDASDTSCTIGDPNLTYGTKLILDQTASGLAKDIIWPERRIINGEEVVVPVLYLTSATVAARKVTNHNIGFNNTVSFNQLEIDNVDIQFGRNAFLQVADNLINSNGTLTGTGDFEIIVGGTLNNFSGIFEATGDLKIGAHNIDSQTIVHRYDFGSEQGGQFGDVAGFSSTTGDVVLKTHQNIVLLGSQVAANQGDITFAANGSIRVGGQPLYSGFEGQENGWNVERSNVEYLQTRLTAEDTIQLIANGEILIDAAEIVSNEGHIEMLAGLGITIEDALGTYQSYEKAKFGSTSKEITTYKTVAMRSLLDAGKGITLHAEFGDITLKAAEITSADGANVKAANGAVNLLMAKETDHYSYSSVKESLFTTKTVNYGNNITTAVHPTIVGGLKVDALYGLNVDYSIDPELLDKYKDDPAVLQENIDNPEFIEQYRAENARLLFEESLTQLSKLEGMEWVTDFRQRDDVNWTGIETEYKTWYESKTNLSPAAMAVVSIAVAVATNGVGSGLVGATTAGWSAAFSAGFTALTTQATISLANGNGLRETIQSLSSSDAIKSLAITMVTAGALGSIDAEFFKVGAGEVLAFEQQVGQALVHATVRAGVGAVLDGADFGDEFVQALAQDAINTLGEKLANEIGEAKALYKIDPQAGISTVTQYIAHAAVGCLTGTATSKLQGGEAELGCYSGAGGAIVGEFIGQQYEEDLKEDVKAWVDDRISINEVQPTQAEIYQQALAFKQQGVDVAKLGAALTAFVTGADVNITANAAANAAENNAIFTTIAILLTVGYTAWVGDGNLYEGLQKIGEGNDPLSQKMAAGIEAGVELASDQFPDATREVFEVLSAVDETVSEGITIIMETKGGQKIERLWNEIPQDQRNAIIGLGKVVTFVIPPAAVGKLTALKNLDVEPGDWMKEPGHENWDRVSEADRQRLDAPNDVVCQSGQCNVGSAAEGIYLNSRPVTEVFQELDGINPYYVVGGRNNNCGSCTNAALERLTGRDLDAIATPNDGYVGRSSFTSVVGFRANPMNSEGVKNLLLAEGNGAVAAVLIKQPISEIDHAIAAVNRNGEIFFIDAQKGVIVDLDPNLELTVGIGY